MHSNVREIIIEILTITQYEGDKEEFAHKLIDVFHKQAVIDVIENLPQEEQEILKKCLAENITPEMEKTLLLEHITPEEYLRSLRQATEAIFREYLETVLLALSDSKKDKVLSYLNSLNPSQ